MRGHRVDRRFGWDCHGLPAEMAVEKEIGVAGRRRDRPSTASTSSTTHCRQSVMRYTAEWERYVTRQARWVDFDRRLQDDGPHLHGVRHLGVQAAVGQGPDLRVLPGAAVLVGRARRRCRTPRSASTTPPVPARTRRSPSASTSTRSTATPARCACSPGPRRRGRSRRTWRSPSAPTSTTTIVEHDGRYVILGAAVRRSLRRASWATDPTSSARSRVPSSPGAPTRRCSRSSPTTSRLVPGPRRRLRRHRGGHRHRPHRPRLRRGRPASWATPTASRSSCPVDEAGQFTAEVPDWAGVNVFDANPDDHRGTSRSRAGSCATRPTTTTTRTAGGPTRRSSTGPCRRGT